MIDIPRVVASTPVVVAEVVVTGTPSSASTLPTASSVEAASTTCEPPYIISPASGVRHTARAISLEMIATTGVAVHLTPDALRDWSSVVATDAPATCYPS